MSIDRRKMEQIARKLSPEAGLVTCKRLEGGVSARITALEIQVPGSPQQTVVVRQHGHAEQQRDPHLAVHEFRLLQILHANRVPVPYPLFVDESGDIFPEPYLVVEFISGQIVKQPANLTSFVTQMATVLRSIHAVAVGEAVGFLASPEAAVTERLHVWPPALDGSLSENRIRDALSNVWPPSQRNRSVLLHGDYWPGNTMWRSGKLIAVIDWEDAAFGDPLADLANGRLEIMMHFGVEALTAFTERYQTLAPDLDYSTLPLWDLSAALRPAGKMSEWELDEPKIRQFQLGHKAFVKQAIDQLTL